MPSPELQLVIDTMRAVGRLSAQTPVAEQRALYDAAGASFPLAPDVEVLPVDAGGVPCEWVRTPGFDDNCALVYLHGGGYVIGSPFTHRELASRMSKAVGVPVLVAGYRLAPEHRYPAALDDACGAYRWLLAEGLEPGRVAIAGDSAGGGLAVATVVALRDERQALPAAALCFSPWFDLTCEMSAASAHAQDDIILDLEWLATMASWYVGDGDLRDGRVSPLFADLAGLPPLCVLVGTDELFCEEAAELCERAMAAGTETTLEVFEECMHQWVQYNPYAPEAIRGIEVASAFLRTHLGI